MIANRLFDLSGTVAIVTGASGWLGQPIAHTLASVGATVVAVGRNVDTLERCCSVWQAEGLSVRARACDITTDAWPTLVADVIDEFGRLDHLINNAHIGRGDSMRTATAELFREANELSIIATWAGIEAARDGFTKARAIGGSPTVVNLSSMYGIVAPDLTLYATEEKRTPPYYGAAKAAILQLTRYAAAELAPEGVRVNAITPGPFPALAAQENPEFIEKLAQRTLIGRVGNPDDIRTAILFLTSPNSGFVTGANIVVDGGWTVK